MTFNEEKCIERCINSIKELADEIIIVDTGSTDKTVDIIRKMELNNIKLFSKKWNEDFSEIRNFMMEKSTKDVIIQVDADEFIDENMSISEIINIISNNINDTTSLSFKIMNLDNSIISKRRPRIFLNNKKYTYYGRIHEQLFSEDEYSIFQTGIILYHDGYDKVKMEEKNKRERNISLLQKMMHEDENIIWNFYYIRDLLVFNKDYEFIYLEIKKFIDKYRNVSDEKDKKLYSQIEVLKVYFEIFINQKFDYSKLEFYTEKYKNDVDYNYILLLLNNYRTKKLLDNIFSIDGLEVSLDKSIFSSNGEHLVNELFKNIFLLDSEQRENLFEILSPNIKLNMKRQLAELRL